MSITSCLAISHRRDTCPITSSSLAVPSVSGPFPSASPRRVTPPSAWSRASPSSSIVPPPPSASALNQLLIRAGLRAICADRASILTSSASLVHFTRCFLKKSMPSLYNAWGVYLPPSPPLPPARRGAAERCRTTTPSYRICGLRHHTGGLGFTAGDLPCSPPSVERVQFGRLSQVSLKASPSALIHRQV